jgi:hypothetical protein
LEKMLLICDRTVFSVNPRYSRSAAVHDRHPIAMPRDIRLA